MFMVFLFQINLLKLKYALELNNFISHHKPQTSRIPDAPISVHGRGDLRRCSPLFRALWVNHT